MSPGRRLPACPGTGSSATGSFPELEIPLEEDWSTREFERSDLPDRRLRAHLKGLGQA